MKKLSVHRLHSFISIVSLALFFTTIFCHANIRQSIKILDKPNITERGKNFIPFEAGPNPAFSGREGVHFKYTGSKKTTVIVAIYDQVGQQISFNTFESVQRNSIFWTWNLTDKEGANVANGCYLAICKSIGEKSKDDGCRILIRIGTL